MKADTPRHGRHIRIGTGIAAGLAVLAALGLYATGLVGNSDGPCGPAAETLATLRPLAKGEVAAFQVADRPGPAPAVAMTAPDGGQLSLSDFAGRTVLLNLWATWCEPCRREMPALDKLQATLGGPAFEVAAVNIDTRNLDRPKAWLEQAGVERLAFYSDHQAKIFQSLHAAGQAEGMPTTLLIDAHGCRLGTLAGPAEWASSDGLALIRAAIAGRREPSAMEPSAATPN